MRRVTITPNGIAFEGTPPLEATFGETFDAMPPAWQQKMREAVEIMWATTRLLEEMELLSSVEAARAAIAAARGAV